MKNLIIVSLLSILLYSCEDRCEGKSQSTGIIENDIILGCNPFPYGADGFVIENDSQYLATLEQVYYDCDTTYIDFNQHTLLVFYAEGKCNASFLKNVERDNDKQKYIYKIKVKDCGRCDVLVSSNNYVLVPKLPQNWTVEFKLE